MLVMTQVSRPLVALLLATVVFFAVWMVALKPKSDSGSVSHTAPLQSAVNKAHSAVAQSNAASAASGGTLAPTPPTVSATASTTASATASSASHPAAASTTTTATASTSATAPPGSQAAAAEAAARAQTAQRAHASAVRAAAQRQAVVTHALRAHKVVAMLFYNFRAADDRAVKQELALVPTYGGLVVKLAIPLAELAQYKVVTTQVPVTGSPTLIIIDRAHTAWTVLGFASEFEISQRVADAVAVRAK